MSNCNSNSSSNSAQQVAQRAKLAFDQAQQSLADQIQANEARNQALRKILDALNREKQRVAVANRQDVEAANLQVSSGKLSSSLASRLDLFSKPGKWESMLQGVEDVINLPSPLDIVTYAKRLATSTSSSSSSSTSPQEKGKGSLDLYRVTCPIGVLLCIFESRPEVIINIASLAIKSGNAAILKGGSESSRTCGILKDIIQESLSESDSLPKDLIQSVETRQEISELLHQDRFIDLVIPRGGNALVQAIQREARMPVMGHADGLCAAYVHQDAELEMTVGTVVDSKIDYPAACNALETLLLHESHLTSGLWIELAQALLREKVLLRCDPSSLRVLKDSSSSHSPGSCSIFQESFENQRILESKAEDYDTEFLDLELAVKVVPSIDAAISHINQHGSNHTDVILTSALSSTSTSKPNAAAEKFTRSISSANVFVNASSRFSDGFRYGFGTEVGISTGKTHARGPVGLEGLVIYKYLLRGNGPESQVVKDFSAKDKDESSARKWDHSELEKTLPNF